MNKSRSTLLMVIGAAVFIVGTGLALFAMRGGDGDEGAAKVQAANTAPAAPAAGQVTAPGANVPSFEIPGGKQALAINVPYVNGVAGYAKAKDKVNVFGTIKPDSPAPASVKGTPVAKLILSNIEVLAVSAPAAAPGGTPNATFVLALTPDQAEQVVYFQVWEGLYLSLARADQPAVSAPGHTGLTAF